MSVTRTLAVAAAALAITAAPAFAQRINTNATGTFGQLQLTNGFQPDPHMVTVSAGGILEATSVNSECFGGYISPRATFTLRYNAGDYNLYLGAVSEVDTTIVVRTPSGQYICDDDSGGSLNPLVTIENPRSGRYQIWVGRFGEQGETAPAFLHISEIGGPEGGDGATGELPDYSLDPAYGSIDLVSGFTPDPHTMEIAAGGELDASAIGQPGCVGAIARAPDYRVNWTAGSGALPLIFSVNSDADTTLVINDAEGNWVCDDDGGNIGLNPSITFASPVSGQYDVWVGTFMGGELQPSTLNVSELTSQ